MAKTDPIGVRFDKDQLQLVLEKEKLSSPQKVVNFLLEKYWWEKKMLPQSVPAGIDGSKWKETNNVNPKHETPNLGSSEAYIEELKGCKTISEIQSVVKKIKSDPNLPVLRRINLENQAKELSKEMYSD
jgi:hypothetical protein